MKSTAQLFSTDRFTRPQKTYADLVKEVSLLIRRPFPATLRLVEKFEPGELQALYDDCISKWRDRGFTGPSHMFWTERKRKLGKL